MLSCALHLLQYIHIAVNILMDAIFLHHGGQTSLILLDWNGLFICIRQLESIVPFISLPSDPRSLRRQRVLTTCAGPLTMRVS